MTETKPKRRWFRFSLRALLVLVTVLCVWLGFKVNAVRKQKEAIDAIMQAGGSFWFDYQYAVGDSNLTNPDPDITPPGPTWLRKFLGDDYFRTPVFLMIGYSENGGNNDIGTGLLNQLEKLPSLRRVMFDSIAIVDVSSGHRHRFSDSDLQVFSTLHHLESLSIQIADIRGDGVAYLSNLTNLGSLEFYSTPLDDAGMEKISKMEWLRSLVCAGTRITNKSLQYIQHLTNLDGLNLCDNDISDDALPCLKRLTNLRTLFLRKTHVTAGGIRELQKSLPNCKISSP